MFGRRATKPPAVFTADTLEEDEILRPSVLTDICKSAKIPLHRLERALMLLQLDHRQATIISESNLFGRLIAVYEQKSDPQTRCLVLQCLSEAMENMHRNEVFEIATLVANTHLGPWCVDKLYATMDEGQPSISDLLQFAAHIVKMSKKDRDHIISRFLLPNFTTVFREDRDAVLFLTKNASLHECHSGDMLHLFEIVLSVVMREGGTLSERHLTYDLVLSIVNNYLFDECDNIDICLRVGFDDLVWDMVLTTRQITEAEFEFLTSYLKYAAALPHNLCDKFRGLCDTMNAENCVEILILLLEYGQRCQAEHNNRWFQMFHHALRVSIAYMPSMAFNRKMVLSELTIGWLV